LASFLTLPVSAERAQSEDRGLDHGFGAALVTLLTVLAIGISGYHPYAEDGGLYLAGAKKLLHPELYPYWSGFVTEHLRFSLFAPMVAGLVRGLHLDLMTVMFGLHVLSFWVTLYAGWQLAARCYVRREERCGAVTLLAVWMGLPIAGTSLMLMDPYVSARSLSTPCSLLALIGMLDFLDRSGFDEGRRWRGLSICVLAMLGAVTLHPLMAAYALGWLLLLTCMLCEDRTARLAGIVVLCTIAISLAAVLCWEGPRESAPYLHAAMTRSYWFVAGWEWYEKFGLIAPLLILGAIGFVRKSGRDSAMNALARVGVVSGSVACVVALLFARTNSASMLVSRLQPLRVFQMVYVLLILVVGAMLGVRFLRQRAVRWVLTFSLLGGVMLFAERQTFPRSAHIELPGAAAGNDWEQAFLWIKQNTPTDARFAMNPRYITEAGEDAQSFRAIAERSALPDYSKDGGEAAITPPLANEWMRSVASQADLDDATDPQRLAVLKPLGVDWVVLRRDARTGYSCGYLGVAVKVCRLP
jgi:hypothetical protein